MNITELPLFSKEYEESSSSLQKQIITKNPDYPLPPQQQEEKISFEQTLSKIFQEPKLQTNAEKARQIIGKSANEIPEEYLESFVAQIDYLTNCWLDQYEKQLFDGKTLREITKIHGI